MADGRSHRRGETTRGPTSSATLTARQQALAEQRAQDEALQAYLDQMSTLLLEKDLRSSEADSEVRTLARARTVTLIQRLDADGNRNVIRFLREANLTGGITSQSSVSLLTQADLQGAHFKGVDLSAIDLSGANLSYANLTDANLSDADLTNADLRGTFLTYTNLSDADLSSATGVTNEELKQQAEALEGATMPNGQKYEDWFKNKGHGEDGENTGPS